MTKPNKHFNKIVNTDKRRVEVRACPGSLKTTALIERLQHILKIGVSPEQNLVLTFSNAAVDVIRGRLKNHPTTPANHAMTAKVDVMTCHKFSLNVLKAAEPNKKVVVLTETAARTVLKRAMALTIYRCKKGKLWPDASQSEREKRLADLNTLVNELPQVMRLIEYARAGNTTTVAVLKLGRFSELAAYQNVIGAVRKCYKELRRKSGDIDYTDMLLRAADLINSGNVKIPHKYVLVDEYQDCSAAQVAVLCALARLPRRSIMVVGDPDQAIYGFSGASYTPLNSVLTNVAQMTLPVSTRLTKETAALACAVVRHTSDKEIQTIRSGEKPTLVCSNTMHEQIPKITRAISDLIEAGTSPNQIVVLARTRAQLRSVEQALLTKGIDSDRENVVRNKKHAVPVLKLVNQIQQHEHLSGTNARALLEDFSHHHDLPTNADLLKAAAVSFQQATRVNSLEGRFRVCAKAYLTLCGGSRKNVELRNDINRWTPLCRGRQSAREMRQLIEGISRVAVTTSTIHAAKGGTWEHVLILGATDGLLPFYQSIGSSSGLCEERHLMYVALTRASKSVTLFHTPTCNGRSRQRFNEISRFLVEPNVQRSLCIKKN